MHPNNGQWENRHWLRPFPRAQLTYNSTRTCNICVAFCPKGVIVLNGDGIPDIINPDVCIGCRFCELHCPDFAITIRQKGDLAERLSRIRRSSKY